MEHATHTAATQEPSLRIGRDERGFTLLEILVVVGLVGALSLILSQVSVDLVSSNQATDLGLVRDQLAINVRALLGNLPSVRASLANASNAYAKGCICGNGPCTSMQVQTPFYLYDSTGSNLQGPKYYSPQGNACNDPSALAPTCFFRVMTEMLAECAPAILPSADPSPLWQCGSGVSGSPPVEFIQLIYRVGPNPNFVSANPQSVSPAGILNTIVGGIYFTVNDVVSGPPAIPAGNLPVCP